MLLGRRLRRWVLRIGVAATATGLLIGTLVALPFALAEGAPGTLLPLAWAVGGGTGAAAGIVSGVLGGTAAVLLSPRAPLGGRSAAIVGFVACAIGSVPALFVLYGSTPDAGEIPFVTGVIIVAAVVGGVLSPETERGITPEAGR